MEESMHVEWLRYARTAIGQELPELTVRLFIYKEDGLIQEVQGEAPGIVLIDKF